MFDDSKLREAIAEARSSPSLPPVQCVTAVIGERCAAKQKQYLVTFSDSHREWLDAPALVGTPAFQVWDALPLVRWQAGPAVPRTTPERPAEKQIVDAELERGAVKRSADVIGPGGAAMYQEPRRRRGAAAAGGARRASRGGASGGVQGRTRVGETGMETGSEDSDEGAIQPMWPSLYFPLTSL